MSTESSTMLYRSLHNIIERLAKRIYFSPSYTCNYSFNVSLMSKSSCYI